MLSLKSAKLFFILAVTLLVAKPFLGFNFFSRIHPPARESIFIKAFTKRKQEYIEDSSYDVIAIQKKLANPVNQLFLPFCTLLAILFPAIFRKTADVENRFLRSLQFNVTPFKRTYLLNGKLII